MSETAYGIPDNWIKLAELDESADYEVDITAIYKDKDEYVLATASGCSCWDGVYTIERFKDLAGLEEALGIENEDREVQPSPKGIKDLITEAKLTEGKVTDPN